jgi:ketosteroid isomerase-like protein
MSQENVEIVRQAMLAAARGDADAVQSFAADTIRFDSLFAGSEGRTFSGPTAARDYFESVGEAFEDLGIELVEIVGEREDRVVIRARLTARGKASGISVDQTYAQVWTLADGKVHEIVSRADLEQALADAGLRE